MKNDLPKWIEDAECRLVLHKNCRNTAEVFKTSCGIMGLKNVSYNDIHGEIPTVKFYQTTAELESILEDFVSRVISEGLKPEDVVILTAQTIEKSWISTKKSYSGISLSLTKEPGKILFTTIRKFKGLESDAVIITDAAMSSLANHKSRRLLYVGASRAKYLLNISMLDDVESGEMGDLMKKMAPGRNVPKNKRGLKRLLNINLS